MAKPYDELMKTFHTAEAKPSILNLKDPELTFQTHMLYATYKKALEHYPAENIAFLGGSSGAAMVLWLMAYLAVKTV